MTQFTYHSFIKFLPEFLSGQKLAKRISHTIIDMQMFRLYNAGRKYWGFPY